MNFRLARFSRGRAVRLLLGSMSGACALALMIAYAPARGQQKPPVAPPIAEGDVPTLPPAFPLVPGQPFTEKMPGTLTAFDMVPLLAGKITLKDSAGKEKTVQVKPVWMGKHEVTWDMYDIYALQLDLPEEKRKVPKSGSKSRPTKPYGAPDRGYGHQGYPVISVTSFAAERFCRWLSARTGRKYRLPTEAEWEYACRAGSQAAPTGAELDKVAWTWDNGDDKTHPVGQKAPNAWGLHDMLGNAREWAIALDGTPLACGGSFYDKVEKITPSAREKYSPEWQITDPQNPKSPWWLSDGPFMGFRIVCEG